MRVSTHVAERVMYVCACTHNNLNEKKRTWPCVGYVLATDDRQACSVGLCAYWMYVFWSKCLCAVLAAAEMVEMEVPVWNWVVANISLMSLGTSAPEILLA